MPPSATNRPLDVLMVDDEPSILDISKQFLETFHGMRVTVMEDSSKVIDALAEGDFQAVVSDYQMPELDGLSLLKKVRSLGMDVPFILFTGRGREEVAIDALNSGADFYVQKGGDPRSQYSDLAHKVRKAVEERDKEKRLRMERKRLERLLNLYKMSDAPEERVFRYALESALDMCEARFGFLGRMIEGGDWISLLCTIGAGTPMEDDAKAKEVEMASGPWMEAVRRREPVVLNDASAVQDITAHCRQSGSVRNMLMVPLLDGDEVVMVLGIGNCPAGFDDSDAQQVSLLLNGAWEIVMRRSSEEKLVQSRKELESHQDRLQQVEIRFHTLFERAQDGVILMGDRFIESNSRWGEMLGYSPEELVGKRPWEVSPAKQPNGRDSREMAEEMVRKAMKDIMAHFEWTHQTKDGRLLECDVVLQKVSSMGEDLILASVRDISKEKKDARVREFMFRVSEAVQKNVDRRGLFASIYDSLSRLFSIDSYYVSLREGEETAFPLIIDHGVWREPTVRSGVSGITEHLIGEGRPLLLDREGIDRLVASGKIVPFGERPEEYMGVPLKVRGRTVGMMVVQNYDGERRFRNEDLDLLTFLSEQVSLALEKIEANEEMKTVNSLLRGTIDSTPIGILVIDERNRVQMANRPLMDMLRATDMAIEGLDGMENLALLVGSAADDGWRVLVDAHLRGDEGTVNVTLSTTDGRIFDTTRSPYTVEGRPAGSIFTVKDVTEVRRMEGVLKESEARLRAIFTAAPVGICVVKDRRFVRSNDRLLKIIGYQKEELIGESTRMLYEDQSEYERVGREVYGPLLVNGVNWTKTRWKRKDGEVIDLLMSVSSFISGEPEKGYVVTLTDLTEIEEARRLLQDRLDFEATLVSVSRMFSEMDSGGHLHILERAMAVIGAQQRADRAYLFEMDHKRGVCSNTVEWVAEGVPPFKDMLQDIPLDSIPWWMSMLREHGAISVPDVSRMPPEASNEKALLEEQGIRSVAITGIFIGKDLTGFLGIDFSRPDYRPTAQEFDLLRFIGEMFSNVLSRWSKEKEAMQEHEKLVNILNGAPMGSLVFFKNGDHLCLTYFNEEGRSVLGEYAEGFLGCLPHEALPFLDEGLINDLLEEAREGEWVPCDRELQDRRSGELYQMWASSLDREHVAVFLLNVTAIKDLDQRLLLANKKLTLLTRLATHDVRNKALIVSANLEMLCLRLRDEWARKYAENANKGLRDLQEVTDHLHNYLSIGSGSLGWTDLLSAAEMALGQLDQVDQPRPSIEIGQGIGGYQVKADHLMSTVLYNLISNSIKHGGGVTRIRLGAERREGELILFVEDDGKGIPADLRGCLFEFSMDGRRQGHGLNFIKETLDMYGMRIELDEEYDRGARFVIRVPAGQFRLSAAA